MDQDTRDLVLGEAIRDFEAGRISMPEAALARSYGYRDAFPRLVITCGPSGAGKSSWIANNLPGYEVISLDDLR
ncbi:MAG: phosphohydrolase, partial [Calditrichaeota bacterium]|nr:phosphohydrolase [Calditrichota bacterium]